MHCARGAQAVAFAHLADESDEDNDEHLPFMGGEPRSAKGGRGAARRRMNDEDAVEAMRILRNELEVGSRGGGVWPKAGRLMGGL